MTGVAEASTLATLGAQHPEWEAWLALFRVARAAIDDPSWQDVVPTSPSHDALDHPLIARATIEIDSASATRLIAELLRRAGLPAISERVAPAFLEAAIAEDAERLDELAAEAGADAALFATAGALAAMPVLHACRRAWLRRVPADWMRASCPICGAWATLAEARGLERRLCLRCGRCGAEWGAQIVRCAFCGTTDHDRLGTLVSEKGGDMRTVETCASCLAYMKTVTTLTACPPEDVRLLDLATVDLDIAALAHGYARPTHVAQRLDTRVTARERRGLFARWRT